MIIMVLTTMTLVTSVLLNGSTPVLTQKMPMLKISRVTQLDNLDQGDFLGANDADFYANITVNGKVHTTEKVAEDDARPNWMIPLDTSTRYNKIKISMWDDDGGLERSDDHADINPKKGVKDLTFTYDRYTGQLWGDADGSFGQTIVSIGAGDDDIARVEFSIVK